MATLNVYLTFNGNAEEAFNFYKSVFKKEFLVLQRFKDVPGEVPTPNADPESIMHVALPFGNATMLMGCDRPKDLGTVGDNFNISLQAESEVEALQFFNGLSAGGKITMPLEKAFWGALFGMLTDKFGIQWMINYEYK